ncbi:MAG: hypothetical protein RIQ93_2451 [Verrucomicrobiota bacterium]|jgi:hypothetical protein
MNHAFNCDAISFRRRLNRLRFTLSAVCCAARLALVLVAGPLVAAEASFTVGAGEVDITPDPQMTNYYTTHKPFGVVHDPLHVRALVLGDGATRVALVAWELLDSGESAVARAREEIQQVTGIPASQIIINATHTHSSSRSPWYNESPLHKGHQNDPRFQEWVEAHRTDPLYRAWVEALPKRCAEAVRLADADRRTAIPRLGRSYAGEWVFNRRPIQPDGSVKSMLSPPDPHSLSNGLRFGRTEPTLTVLQFRDPGDKVIATLFHLPCHSVAIYPVTGGVSADWSAPVLQRLKQEFGGAPAIFLQGCAGDIVPVRRGFEAVAEMAKGVSARALTAVKNSVILPTAAISHQRAVIGLPLTAPARQATGLDFVPAEVHVIAIGPLAIVTLPGEPLVQLGYSIQEQSPYPHTVVLGYSNGRGGGYVGMPGDKVKGGYEMGPVGRATDEAGQLMIDTAVRLLREGPTMLAPARGR